jgi:hypothetical protein
MSLTEEEYLRNKSLDPLGSDAYYLELRQNSIVRASEPRDSSRPPIASLSKIRRALNIFLVATGFSLSIQPGPCELLPSGRSDRGLQWQGPLEEFLYLPPENSVRGRIEVFLVILRRNSPLLS